MLANLEKIIRAPVLKCFWKPVIGYKVSRYGAISSACGWHLPPAEQRVGNRWVGDTPV